MTRPLVCAYPIHGPVIFGQQPHMFWPCEPLEYLKPMIYVIVCSWSQCKQYIDDDKIWECPSELWATRACTTATRNLTHCDVPWLKDCLSHMAQSNRWYACETNHNTTPCWWRGLADVHPCHGQVKFGFSNHQGLKFRATTLDSCQTWVVFI